MATEPTPNLERAEALLNQDGQAFKAGEMSPTVVVWKQEQTEYRVTIPHGHKDMRVNVANAQTVVGAQLCAVGKYNEALSFLRPALAQYQILVGQEGMLATEHMARTHMNTAVALEGIGEFNEALVCFREAEALYQKLIKHGGNEYLQASLAMTRMNIGDALKFAGQLDEALAYLCTAETQYRALIGLEQRGLYTKNTWSNIDLRTETAKTRSQIGSVLAAKGKPGEALVYYREALVEFQKLVKDGHEHRRENVAITQLEMGVSLFSSGKRDEAITVLRAALAQFQTLVKPGQDLVRMNMASTQMVLGEMLFYEGKFDSALDHLVPAWECYQQMLVTNNQRGQVSQFSKCCRLLREVWSEKLWASPHSTGQPCTPAEWAQGIQAMKTSLVQQRALVPTPVHVWLQHLQELFHSMNSLWGAAADLAAKAPWIKGFALNVLTVWLEHVAQLLLEDADFVSSEFERALSPMLYQTLRMALDLGGPEDVANWFLCTQGVRLQRLWLLEAQSGDPDVAALFRLVQRLEVLALEVSGDQLSQTVSQRQQLAAVEYQRLRMHEFEPLKKQLTDAGKYPETSRLTLDDVRQRLMQLHADGVTTAVLLLIPLPLPEDNALVAVSLGHQAQSDRLWRLQMPIDGLMPAQTRLQRWLGRIFPSGHSQINQKTLCTAWERLQSDAKAKAKNARWAGAASEYALTATPSSGWRGGVLNGEDKVPSPPLDQTTDDSDFDDGLLTDDEWHQLLHGTCLKAAQALQPCLQGLSASGMQAVHVIPAGDWHTVPWAAELDQTITDLAVRQFPTTVGWSRTVQASEVRHGVAASTSIRWASLAYDAVNHAGFELLWVGAEQAAVSSLWQSASPQQIPPVQVSPTQPEWPLSRAATFGAVVEDVASSVNCLACIGHGDVPEGNLALAGMLLPAVKQNQGGKQSTERFAMFTAAHLHQIRHAHRLVMSCCVLGLIGDAHGEPVGMTALAFAFKTRFGVGAMLPIPDLEGALFFMALHHAWSRAELASAATGQPADWAGVFHAVRRQVMAGRWPDGFGEWLVGVWWPLVDELDDPLANKRGYWLENADDHWAQTPSKAVQQVAAVTVCLG